MGFSKDPLSPAGLGGVVVILLGLYMWAKYGFSTKTMIVGALGWAYCVFYPDR